MLGNHILATTMSGMPILFIGGRGSTPSGRLANLLHHMSSKYGNNVYAHGVLFGSTLMMGLIMHVMSSYYGGVSRCVTKSHAAWINGDGGHHALTGGYSNDDDDSISSSSTTTHHNQQHLQTLIHGAIVAHQLERRPDVKLLEIALFLSLNVAIARE